MHLVELLLQRHLPEERVDPLLDHVAGVAAEARIGILAGDRGISGGLGLTEQACRERFAAGGPSHGAPKDTVRRTAALHAEATRSAARTRRSSIRDWVFGSVAQVVPGGRSRCAGPCLHCWIRRTRSIVNRRACNDACAAQRRLARGSPARSAVATATSVSAALAAPPERQVTRSATWRVPGTHPRARETTSASLHARRSSRPRWPSPRSGRGRSRAP